MFKTFRKKLLEKLLVVNQKLAYDRPNILHVACANSMQFAAFIREKKIDNRANMAKVEKFFFYF